MELIGTRTSVWVSLLFGLALNSCGAQVDHIVSQELSKELAEQSKRGLALARFSANANMLELHFFDGRNEQLPLQIDGELKVISRGRIAILDLDPSIRRRLANAALQGDSATFLKEFAQLGGNIVLLSDEGKIERRSVLSINASVIAVSSDGERFAFVGVPQGISESQVGVYVGQFDRANYTRLRGLGPDDPRQRQDALEHAVLDWSPDGKLLLFSYRGTITAFDTNTGASRRVAEGGSALWSPAGDQISYIGSNFSANLFDVSTGKASAIDPGFQINSPIEWSPDGKYLLIPEGEGSHVPYGCHWVYKIQDRTFFPVCDYHMINPRPFWIRH